MHSKKFALTSFYVIPAEWKQFRAICEAVDVTAAARIRQFFRSEIRRAAKEAAKAKK